ncbi:hypothetical protein FACS1894120_1300 [Clostridia bacterium]|nr:hypothetical protein FACS1894120_1300 [Clostridia bacterium]
MLKNIILTAVYLALASCGQVFFKLGSKDSNLSFADKSLFVQMNIYAIVGLIMYVVSFLLFLVVVSRFNLSFIYPVVVGVSYTLVVIMSVAVLKEQLTRNQIIGIVIVLTGLIIMNIKK